MSPRRVLLDENIPLRLRLWMPHVEAVTVEFMGWKGTRNGALVRLAKLEGFEVLVTADWRLAFQPRAWSPLACVYLTSEKPARIRPAAERIQAMCQKIIPGQVVTLDL